MSLFNIVKDSIYKNKTLKQEGAHIGVPNPFSRLTKYLPLIAERGHSVGILGATGSGKSRFTRYLYIYHAYKFYKETGYPLRIIYFPLEDNKEKVMRNMICHYLHELHGIYINLMELDSKGDKELPDDVVDKLEEAEDFFKEFENIITVVDGLNEPTEIYNFCEEYALRTGQVEQYELEVNGKIIKQSRYVANDDIHTIIIVDNMSNIDIEEGQPDERRSIVHFCKTLVRGRLCNFFNFTVVQVLQQDFASERQSFTRDGETMVAKLEPSLAGIGDAKTISRNMHIVFGIFHPSRFGIVAYPVPNKKHQNKSYRLDILGNRFRSLHILKANDIDFGQKLAFNFDAVTENMTELPELGTQELDDLYAKIMNKYEGKFTPVKTERKPLFLDDIDEDEETPF